MMRLTVSLSAQLRWFGLWEGVGAREAHTSHGQVLIFCCETIYGMSTDLGLDGELDHLPVYIAPLIQVMGRNRGKGGSPCGARDGGKRQRLPRLHEHPAKVDVSAALEQGLHQVLVPHGDAACSAPTQPGGRQAESVTSLAACGHAICKPCTPLPSCLLGTTADH